MPKLLILLLILLTACATEKAPQATYQFNNGLWYDGQTFKPETAYIVDGQLQFSSRPLQAEKIINLDNGYVVPPYCEGHNHNLGGSIENVEETVQQYLQDGVFYAMMPGSFAFYRAGIDEKINNPTSVDVAFSNNGLTGAGGHPRGLRESLMDRYGLYPEFTKETLPDKGYFEADTLEQLREKWVLILAERPDFIKVMLYFSEEYELRKDNPDYYGRRGLNPDFLPELVRMADDANLRVAVHVESEADMATALRAGASIIAHFPSYDSTVRISDATIALAKENGAAIVTTFTVAKRYEQRTPDKYIEILKAQGDNLIRLHKAGVILVVGSDSVRDTSRKEAHHLAELGVLDNGAILKMWTENCAQTVFPDRKIGRLAEGYEASFIVLEGDPLVDFENTNLISHRIKDGEFLYSDE